MENMNKVSVWWKVLQALIDDKDIEHSKEVLDRIEQLENKKKKVIRECKH